MADEEKKINAEDVNNLKARLNMPMGPFWKKVQKACMWIALSIFSFLGAAQFVFNIPMPDTIKLILLAVGSLFSGGMFFAKLGIDPIKVDQNNNQ